MKKTGWIAFLIILGTSCLEEPDCYRLDNNLIGITHRVIGSGSNARINFEGITTEGTDSIFRSPFSGTNFTLPLSPLRDEMTFLFQGIDKMMKIGYLVRPQFVSEDCGPRLIYSDLEVIEHDFDSVRVVSSFPGEDNKAKNIEIFRCPVIENTIIGFYQLYSRARSSEQITIPVTGITSDFTGSRIFLRNVSRNQASLPLNKEAISTTFVFDLGGEPQELMLEYDTITEVRYRPCGSQTFISGIGIGSSTFDSVSVVRDERGILHDQLTDPAEMNVKIFRCPVTDLVQLAFKEPALTGTGTIDDEVALSGIRTDYSSEVFYASDTVTTVTLPLNPAANTTTFYIDYYDRTETLVLNYTRADVAIFQACQQTVFFNLHEGVDLGNVTLKADSLTFPPVTNFEILSQ